jgi:HAD superfamily hydrolase (TIGR01490 family)
MIVAVFDVDHTLIPGDSLKRFAWYILTRGDVKYRYLPGFSITMFKYGLGLASAEVLKTALLRALLCGTRLAQAQEQAAQFTRECLIGNVYQKATERIKWHKERNHRIVLLSASPEIYLKKFASLIGADTLICTRLVARDGCLTGELAGENCKGEEKLKRLSSEATLRGADWDASYGYGNSAEDIPFLQALGIPTAVNPDRKLKKMALRLGWKIENWRS